MSAKKLKAAADWADRTLSDAGIALTMGGEPTYVPEHPEGAEWTFSAVGPTKLAYARRMAEELLKTRLAGGVVFFSPGKQYPGEVNPRWALRMVTRRDGKPIFAATPGNRRTEEAQCEIFLSEVLKKVGGRGAWIRFKDPKSPKLRSWVLPLDHVEDEWVVTDWKLKPDQRSLVAAEGPAGLRLPLYLLAEDVPRRALVAELKEGRLSIFFPPLLQGAFMELAGYVGDALNAAKIVLYELQGYVPSDEEKIWITLGLAADPGVLEINLPPCAKWEEYDGWMRELEECATRCGLRSWKQPWDDFPAGTGGGNHMLWGGPSLDENPFFTRPAWLASALRHIQRRPSLAYLFTGCYVGSSSQAPRPDESSKEMFDLEMAYRFLETLPEGDHRVLMNETLRHLQTDVTGNAHRSETSFDKFWNPSWPGGCLGLIEFRAIESLPRAEWMSAVALLWRCLAALAHAAPASAPLRRFGRELHDRYFLPTAIWEDLAALFDEFSAAGCELPQETFRAIWDWRFPKMLEHEGVEVRRAHESWPLLCETPVEGGSTSRFVDTSMHRFEVCATEAFAAAHDIHVHGRLLPLATAGGGKARLAGVRYRRSCLYPCLHPGIPVQLPLDLAITKAGATEVVAAYRMHPNATSFVPLPPGDAELGGPVCRPIFDGALTHDLRLS